MPRCASVPLYNAKPLEEFMRTHFSKAASGCALTLACLVQAASAQAFRSGTTLRASHERQARRIAAAYGISW